MKLIRYYIKFLGIALMFSQTAAYSQAVKDSLVSPAIEPSAKGNSQQNKTFSFITHVPGNLAGIVKTPFQKKSIKPLLVIGVTTTALLILDEPIIKGTGRFFKGLGIKQQENFHTLIGIGDMDILKYPGNINSFFYQLGEAAPTFLVAGGFYLYGKIARNAKAIETTKEITESFITTEIAIQILKRVAG